LPAEQQPIPLLGELAHFYRRTERLSEMEAAINQSLAAARRAMFTEFDSAALYCMGWPHFTGRDANVCVITFPSKSVRRGARIPGLLPAGICWKDRARRRSHHRVQGCRDIGPQYKPARMPLGPRFSIESRLSNHHTISPGEKLKFMPVS